MIEDELVRRALGDALWSAGGLVLLLSTLVAFDERVRSELAARVVAVPAAGVSETGAKAANLVGLVADIARDQAATHTPLLLFAFAGVLLVLFMFRS